MTTSGDGAARRETAADFPARRRLFFDYEALNIQVSAFVCGAFPSSRMSRHPAAAVCSLSRVLPLLAVVFTLAFVGGARAYGPSGFDTVVIDAGHGGVDRGGGPGQVIPEKPYTLDTALRLESALRRRGFRTFMTRRDDVFVTLRDRVAMANSFRNAIFVSVHYNSGQRLDAHGYETYYYRSDSFGLAARLHQAQLSTYATEDRRVRRRGFYVIRNTAIPAVLCEGGFLTNPQESRVITSASYRQRWAENIANALVQQRNYGDPVGLGSQPPVTSERLVSSSRGNYSRRTVSSSRRSGSVRRSSSRRGASVSRRSSSSKRSTASKRSAAKKKTTPARKRRN